MPKPHPFIKSIRSDQHVTTEITSRAPCEWMVVIVGDGEEKFIADCPTSSWATTIASAMNGIGFMPSDMRTHPSMLTTGLRAEVRRKAEGR